MKFKATICNVFAFRQKNEKLPLSNPQTSVGQVHVRTLVIHPDELSTLRLYPAWRKGNWHPTATTGTEMNTDNMQNKQCTSSNQTYCSFFSFLVANFCHEFAASVLLLSDLKSNSPTEKNAVITKVYRLRHHYFKM